MFKNLLLSTVLLLGGMLLTLVAIDRAEAHHPGMYGQPTPAQRYYANDAYRDSIRPWSPRPYFARPARSYGYAYRGNIYGYGYGYEHGGY